MTTEQTACILCSRNCGLTVEIEAGQFAKIKGDPSHPFTHGYICQKAARLGHYQSHADRLSTPLKRQPDGSFQAISWDTAITEIAGKLLALKAAYGGDSFAFLGGGGQGNHLGGAYSRQLLAAMRSKFAYNSLGQEKTGDFWVNGRLFGSQTCHTTEDVEHADFVMFIGTNPYQAHGIPNARDTLKAIKKDPHRTMVVIDPRRSETAEMADIHLQLKPGTDAFLMSAMLGVIVQEDLIDHKFLDKHCNDVAPVLAAFKNIPVAQYAAIADVGLEQVQQVARAFAAANKACVRIDLGIQQSLNTTLNGYLEKLLYLITGHFGRSGCNNLHSFFLPILGNTDERKVVKGKSLKKTAYHGMIPIAGIYPPNILPDEIELAGDKRIRAVFVDSANPLNTFADTNAYERAFAQLDLLVVVDTAMTETARAAHYILPAASQFEKWECTGFNLEFPTNGFHLRHPLFTAHGQSLPEAEIYTRLLEAMHVLPKRFPVLEQIARFEPKATLHSAYMAALGAYLVRHKKWIPYAASVIYRTLGAHLKDKEGRPAAAAAPLLPLSHQFANTYYTATRRAGFAGNRITMGAHVFDAILNSPAGVVLSRHQFQEVWSLIAYPDRKIKLAIPEMLQALAHLEAPSHTSDQYPFILMAGERRTYNANQIYRDPQWRKVDHEGFMRMHPADAQALQVVQGNRVNCRSATGQVQAVIEVDDSIRQGVVTLPHGYGIRFAGNPPHGPQINRLTSSAHCEPFTKTPYHKHVPVAIEKVPA